jgi:cyanate lyase
VCFYRYNVGGEAGYIAGLECRCDRGNDFSVGVLVHGVGAADVQVDEYEGASVVGHQGGVAKFEPKVYRFYERMHR